MPISACVHCTHNMMNFIMMFETNVDTECILCVLT